MNVASSPEERELARKQAELEVLKLQTLKEADVLEAFATVAQ